MTKKMLSAVLAGTAVLAISLGATAANAATAQGSATATILQPVTITAVAATSLNFGTIVPSTTAGENVVVSTLGARSACTVVTCSGTSDAQDFTVTGTAGYNVNITSPASISLTSGANSMTLTLANNSTSGVLALGTGSATLSFGGTLAVGTAQAAGVYNGTWNVTADYQ